MIKVGIIGYGKFGKIRHEAINLNNYSKIESIYDPVKVNLDSEIIFSKSIDEILYNKEIDAVFICSPNYMHKELTIKSLRAGKHVFCEKPPAFNAREIKEIMLVEKSCDKKLMYGFNHRHHQSIIKMKNIIENNNYGKVLWMRGRYGKSVDKSFYDNWRSKRELAGGGILIDQGIHMLDLFLFLGGDFDNIQATVSNLFWKLDVEDNVFVIMENTKTGMSASLHSTMTQWRHLFSLEIFLEEGYMVLNGLKTSSKTYGEEVLTIAKNRSIAPASTWKHEEEFHFKIFIFLILQIQDLLSCLIEQLQPPLHL